MTPHQKYITILTDIERLLAERASRYFRARYNVEPVGDMQVQCDTITVLLEQYLKPHVLWFESYEESQHTEDSLLLETEAPEEGQDAEH